MTGAALPEVSQADPFVSPRGFTHAVRRVMPNLRMYARRLTRNEADTDDLVQDTLARAWAARARFEIGTNLKAWLMRIARNSFLSGKRKDRRSVSWDPSIAERLLIAPATQDEGIFSNELDEAVLSLSTGQRAAFELVTRDGLTFEEAADRLGVPLGTVKSRVSRARRVLVDGFENEAPPQVQLPTPPAPAREASETGGANAYRNWKRSGSRIIG